MPHCEHHDVHIDTMIPHQHTQPSIPSRQAAGPDTVSQTDLFVDYLAMGMENDTDVQSAEEKKKFFSVTMLRPQLEMHLLLTAIYLYVYDRYS